MMHRVFNLAVAAVAGFICGTPVPAVSQDVISRRLFEDFEGSDFSTAGGLYYRTNEEQQAGAIEFQKVLKRNGAGAVRLSVGPRCPSAEGACSERAEVWELPSLRVPFGTAVWYGFAVSFGDAVPDDERRYVVAQWKREIGPEAVGDFSPFLAIRVSRGRLFVTVEANHDRSGHADRSATGCPAGTSPTWYRPETNQMRALVATSPGWSPIGEERYTDCSSKIVAIRREADLPEPSSGWIDFAVLSNPGPDGLGRIELFANGRWIVTVRGAIGQADSGLGSNQYFKFGPYRDHAPGQWALYFDDFVRSPHCRDVLEAEDCLLIDRISVEEATRAPHYASQP